MYMALKDIMQCNLLMKYSSHTIASMVPGGVVFAQPITTCRTALKCSLVIES